MCKIQTVAYEFSGVNCLSALVHVCVRRLTHTTQSNFVTEITEAIPIDVYNARLVFILCRQSFCCVFAFSPVGRLVHINRSRRFGSSCVYAFVQTTMYVFVNIVKRISFVSAGISEREKGREHRLGFNCGKCMSLFDFRSMTLIFKF